MPERLKLLKQWLETDLGLENYTLEPASEDASFRRYFRVQLCDESVIVMDAPPDKENCSSYIDITERLLECRVAVPKIKATELDKGFLMLTDLGPELYLNKLTQENADSYYGDAIDALLRIQTRARTKGLPYYDDELLMQEMELFPEWLLRKHLQLELAVSQQQLLADCFERLKLSASSQPQIFVHRDYHSRNLLFYEPNNPGIVDFQDAVIGPATYDLVSLLKDCYVKWPRSKVLGWVRYYYGQVCDRLQIKASEQQFLNWFDLMGVQRQLKASGIFARLYHRDGKANYLNDIPRTLSYILDLEKDYPELSDLIDLIKGPVMEALERGEHTCAR